MIRGYDATLKRVPQSLTAPAFRLPTGLDKVVRWHNAELSHAGNLRADLLGETADGRLVHIEPQSTNESRNALADARIFGGDPARARFF